MCTSDVKLCFVCRMRLIPYESHPICMYVYKCAHLSSCSSNESQPSYIPYDSHPRCVIMIVTHPSSRGLDVVVPDFKLYVSYVCERTNFACDRLYRHSCAHIEHSNLYLFFEFRNSPDAYLSKITNPRFNHTTSAHEA